MARTFLKIQIERFLKGSIDYNNEYQKHSESSSSQNGSTLNRYCFDFVRSSTPDSCLLTGIDAEVVLIRISFCWLVPGPDIFINSDTMNSWHFPIVVLFFDAVSFRNSLKTFVIRVKNVAAIQEFFLSLDNFDCWKVLLDVQIDLVLRVQLFS